MVQQSRFESSDVEAEPRVTQHEADWLREQLRLAAGAFAHDILNPLPVNEASLMSSLTGTPAADGGDGLGVPPLCPAVQRPASPVGAPSVVLERWPNGRRFALFLSHDVDQIHDRELFRILGDCNHVRRVLCKGEQGRVGLSCARMARALFRPKPVTTDFETLVEIEGRHGFRSTYFLLDDRYWARNGSRYRITDPDIQRLGKLVQDAGHELAVHGGYYRFNDPAAYAESRSTIGRLFNCQPTGIRNHLLRFSYPETWRAQKEAGFTYDATYGCSTVPGPRSMLAAPFWAFDRIRQRLIDLLIFPLTLMDNTLFRPLGKAGEGALEVAVQIVSRVVNVGGLVSLLWHNNYFNEPEYWDWQWVYERLLEELAAQGPWCGTGAEIAEWWRARSVVTVEIAGSDCGWQVDVVTPLPIRGLTLSISSRPQIGVVTPTGSAASVTRARDGWTVRFGELGPGSTTSLRLQAVQ